MDNTFIARAKSLLSYDPDTGVFTWKVEVGRRYGGKVAGKIDRDGYRRIGIDGRHYRAHRLAWAFANGPTAAYVDHINGVPDDNRASNLREATASQNRANSRMHSLNKSGFRGVSFNKRHKKWQASIGANGKARHLGYFKTIEEAVAARECAARLLHGDFNPALSSQTAQLAA